MDKQTAIKSMVNNMINDKQEQAAMDIHQYFTVKMREMIGLAPVQEAENPHKAEVLSALKTATTENDYSFKGMSAEEITDDLMSFDAALEDADRAQVIAAVKEWMKSDSFK